MDSILRNYTIQPLHCRNELRHTKTMRKGETATRVNLTVSGPGSVEARTLRLKAEKRVTRERMSLISGLLGYQRQIGEKREEIVSV